MTKKAVILHSGGLDSTTCLAIALDQGFECYTLSITYGQKHSSEILASIGIATRMGAKAQRIFYLPLGDLRGSALTDDKIDVPDYVDSAEIPVTYVPARNTLFLSIALAWAEVIKAYDIFIGVSSIDYSHYPDCRPEYIEQFQKLATLATKVGVEGASFKIHAPLLHLSKAETILRGIELGVNYAETVSCYRANDEGHACGTCDSCTFRRKGFKEAGIEDPTQYVSL